MQTPPGWSRQSAFVMHASHNMTGVPAFGPGSTPVHGTSIDFRIRKQPGRGTNASRAPSVAPVLALGVAAIAVDERGASDERGAAAGSEPQAAATNANAADDFFIVRAYDEGAWCG